MLTAGVHEPPLCVHELVERRAVVAGDAIAAVCGDRHLTYGALNARADRLAHVLRTHGVGPESVVAVCVERSLKMIVGWLAALKAGAAYLCPAFLTVNLSRGP
jgi:non-ribosomal peptide synthetase component F